MIYGSVCSGIEAASVSWKHLGWKPGWFSEIKPFCNEVLKFHWPEVRNLGSLTDIRKDLLFQNTKIDLLVGGTPCQAFSLAGDRKGLSDPRGDLTLEYIKCIEDKRPEWFIWENVPGVMSLNGGRDFGAIIRKMVEFRYGVAYTILDAKDFGLPQTRPRVFVVGHSSGDERIPARILGITASRDNNFKRSSDEAWRIPTLTLRNAGNRNARGVAVIESVVQGYGPDGQARENKWKIRSLTPYEEERRQGFSGVHTRLVNATDTDRYEAIGNSMAVPVMKWLGDQIEFERFFPG